MLPSQLNTLIPLVLPGLLLAACAHQPTTTSDKHHQAKQGATDTWEPQPEVYENQLVSMQDPILLQTGRYSYLPAKPRPEQLNPLLTVIDVHIPDGIDTVKDSAQYLLQFSGYQLSQPIKPESHVVALLQRNIPEVHRHFEQVVLRDALLALCGNGYRLLVDPVNRLVAYERDPKYPGWTEQ
jgi:type IV pili sensor histidine kinase/response regulator